ncbi:MAG: exonuclease domain-containing protein [Desulfopila sp.]|jgi:DNA polymerase-3 subunit epsilon|nr:exonuclease domain-containing protein [Desulfopila sp.]
MTKTNPFWKLVFLSLGLTVIFIFLICLCILLRLDAEQLDIVKEIASQNVYFLLLLTTVVPVALWVIFEICYTRFYLPLRKIPTEISVMCRTNPSHRLDYAGNHNIRELSQAINALADVNETLSKNLDLEIGKAREETEKERNMLAAIMAELPFGLILCNSNGRILLFNSQAKAQFSPVLAKRRSEYFLGLGRSIFHIIDKTLISHALQEIEERLQRGKKRVASYFTTQIENKEPVLVETIPVLDQERRITGFILSLQDISNNIKRYDSISRGVLLLDKSVEESIARIAEIVLPERTAVPHRMVLLEQCFDTMRRHHSSVFATILEAAFETIPLSRLNLDHFLFVIQKTAGYGKNIRVNVSGSNRDTRILGDLSSFVAAFVFVLEKLAELTSHDEFDLQVLADEKIVEFEITWDGKAVRRSDVAGLAVMYIASLLQLDYVLRQNKASLQYDDTAEMVRRITISARVELQLPFPGFRRSPVIAGSRPEYYDFNLFEAGDESLDLLNSTLDSLTYSVIDTETTGLHPGGGDEIVAIGAVRIVKNRIVLEDCFEQLVNPGRDIPFEAYKIHGIDPTMVSDKPDIDSVLPALKRYISSTVIVGHDVGFDMKMIKMKEKSANVVFNNPVLDTLLLSAMLHPIYKQHNIESIAARLGVTIVGRHTATGDAVAAAEIFLKLIPLLQSRGITTLKEALEASKRTYFLRLRY